MSQLILQRYGQILEAARERKLQSFGMCDYLRQKPDSGFIILRHDVEWNACYALRMARLETEHGFKAVYYFRGPHLKKVFQPDIMKQIEQMGHEVGYHYETLDQCDGNRVAAEKLFEQSLRRFRDEGITVRTVCQHGNPRKKKIGYEKNGDLFRDRIPDLCRNYDLTGEAYLSVDFAALRYISDVGIRFRSLGGGSQHLIDFIRSGKEDRLYLLTHPDYWSTSRMRAASLYLAARAIHGFGLNQAVAAARHWRDATRFPPVGDRSEPTNTSSRADLNGQGTTHGI